MPELDVLLALFPAEEDFLSTDKGREINQPPINIFDLNFTLFESEQDVADNGNALQVFVHQFASEVVPQPQCLRDAFVVIGEQLADFNQFLQPLLNQWEKLAG